jgi:hypothetical protein
MPVLSVKGKVSKHNYTQYVDKDIFLIGAMYVFSLIKGIIVFFEQVEIIGFFVRVSYNLKTKKKEKTRPFGDFLKPNACWV